MPHFLTPPPPSKYYATDTAEGMQKWSDDIDLLKNKILETVDNFRDGRVAVGLAVDSLLAALSESMMINCHAIAEDNGPLHADYFQAELDRINQTILKTITAMSPQSVCSGVDDMVHGDSH